MSNFSVIIPREGTNLVENPSFETGATSWTAGTSNTITSEHNGGGGEYRPKFGYKAGVLKRTVDDVYASCKIDVSAYMVNGLRYQASAWVMSNVANDSPIKIGIFTSNFATEWAAGTPVTLSEAFKWYQVKVNFVWSSSWTTPFLALRTTVPSGVSASNYYVIDGVMCEQIPWDDGEIYGTYIDGDQPGCKWLGTRHGSRSYRPADTRLGGAIKSLEDYGLTVQFMQGNGMPEVANAFKKSALIDGLTFHNTNIGGTKMRLVSTVIGSTLKDYHDQRAELIQAVAPWHNLGDEPILFRYEGADVIKQGTFRYSGGLGLGKANGFSEKFSVEFESESPYWQGIGNDGQVCGGSTEVQSTTGHPGLIRILNDGTIDQFGLSHSHQGTGPIDINKVLHDPRDGKVYVCGQFNDWAGNTTMDNIAIWNQTTEQWDSAGGLLGPNNRIYDACLRPEGGIFVAGSFTNLGDADGDFVAAWTGSQWVSVKAGLDSYATSIAVGQDNYLYITGNFGTVGGIPNTATLVKYDLDLDAWSAVNTAVSAAGVSGFLDVVRVAGNGDVWIGGQFSLTIDTFYTAQNVVKLVDGAETYVGQCGTGSDHVYEIIPEPGGRAYAVGFIGTTGAQFYNGSQWENLGSGLHNDGLLNSPSVYMRSGTKWKNGIAICGEFDRVGDTPIRTFSILWNGTTWVPPQFDFPSGANTNSAYRISAVGDELWIAFDTERDDYWLKNYVTTVDTRCTAKVYPTFHFTGGLDYASNWIQSIKNITTGAEVYLDYSLLHGEKLQIIFQPTQYVLRSDVFGDSVRMLPSSDVSRFWLAPGVTNRISILAGPDLGNANFITWKENFWGVD